MNIVYYGLGSFIYLVFTVLYDVFTTGSVQLTAAKLTELAIRAALAGLAFFAADYLMKKRN